MYVRVLLFLCRYLSRFHDHVLGRFLRSEGGPREGHGDVSPHKSSEWLRMQLALCGRAAVRVGVYQVSACLIRWIPDDLVDVFSKFKLKLAMFFLQPPEIGGAIWVFTVTKAY